MLDMGRRGQTRRTQWCHLLVSIFILSKVMSKSLLMTSDDFVQITEQQLHLGHPE